MLNHLWILICVQWNIVENMIRSAPNNVNIHIAV